MKTILATNGSLAAVWKMALKDYFRHPTPLALCFSYRTHRKCQEELARFLTESEARNPHETYLVMTDMHGSAAWVETRLMLQRFGLENRAVIYTDTTLPMLVQLYDEEDDIAYDDINTQKVKTVRHTAA